MMKDIKKVVFITGTRADYGKMKPLMRILEQSSDFDVHIFVCGMHLSEKLGSTYKEVIKDKYKNIYVADEIGQSYDAGLNLGNTISCLSAYIGKVKPDMIVVHGDRMDALAGAVVGTLRNILVGHVEGGELSGTIDESIRHAISKFAHVHFVSNEEAADRLIQMGEEPQRIFVTGSPDIDIMINDKLPDLEEAKTRYDIPFENYGILIYHPVTTEIGSAAARARQVVDAVIESGKNYVVVYPNNDLGSDVILKEYERLEADRCFRVFPSLRFEYFLTLLRNAGFMLGNSSAGVRESGIYGIPAIDIGTRQSGRYQPEDAPNVIHVHEDKYEILNALENIGSCAYKTQIFGDGKSAERFCSILRKTEFWETGLQKHFVDLYKHT